MAEAKRTEAVRVLKGAKKLLQGRLERSAIAVHASQCLDELWRRGAAPDNASPGARGTKMLLSSVIRVLAALDQPPLLQDSECLRGGALRHPEVLGDRRGVVAVSVAPRQVSESVDMHGVELELASQPSFLCSEKRGCALEELADAIRVHELTVSCRYCLDKLASYVPSSEWYRVDTIRRKEETMKKATFYHAGCPVCVSAEQQFVGALDKSAYDVEIVHLGDVPTRLSEAEGVGVKSVPALVLDGQPFHINFGASMEDLRK